jgi:hypothetical protein
MTPIDHADLIARISELHLALVQLARYEPVTANPTGRRTCQFCGESANWGYEIKHKPNCGVQIARELIEPYQINWY